jgi:hypothetical protein
MWNVLVLFEKLFWQPAHSIAAANRDQNTENKQMRIDVNTKIILIIIITTITIITIINSLFIVPATASPAAVS